MLRYFLFCLFFVKLLSLTFRNDGVGWNSKNQNKVTKNKPALGNHLSGCIFDLKTYPYRNSPYTRQFFDNWQTTLHTFALFWPPTYTQDYLPKNFPNMHWLGKWSISYIIHGSNAHIYKLNWQFIIKANKGTVKKFPPLCRMCVIRA